jgi:sugar phosphate permease
VPPYIVGAFVTLLLPYLSWKTRQRALYMCIAAPFVMLGYAIFLGTSDPQARYAAVFMIAIGAFVFGPFCNTWAAINTTSDTARAATLSATVFAGNLGGLAVSRAIRPRDTRGFVWKLTSLVDVFRLPGPMYPSKLPDRSLAMPQTWLDQL